MMSLWAEIILVIFAALLMLAVLVLGVQWLIYRISPWLIIKILISTVSGGILYATGAACGISLPVLTRVSVAHPRKISKRQTSRILVNIYLPLARGKVKSFLITQFEEEKYVEHIMHTRIPKEMVVEAKLFCPGITFSDPVRTKLNDDKATMAFIARPDDSVQHGKNHVKISISDGYSGEEYFSGTFSIMVADFAFDHVPQPVFSKISALILGIGSLLMFTLTFMKGVDAAFGLTSGATAAALATTIYGRFLWLFHKPGSHQIGP
jgi:hypothetical protein